MGNKKGYKNSIIPYVIRKSATKEFVCEWRVGKSVQSPGYGKPTTENLSAWRDKFNQSLKAGGANEHIGVAGWLQCGLEIYSQVRQEVVCTYSPPMFEVIND